MKKNGLLKLCCGSMAFVYLLSTAAPIAYADEKITRRKQVALEERKESKQESKDKKKPTRNSKGQQVPDESSKSDDIQSIPMEEDSETEELVIKPPELSELEKTLLESQLNNIKGIIPRNLFKGSLYHQYFKEGITKRVDTLKEYCKEFSLPRFAKTESLSHIDLIIKLFIQLRHIQVARSDLGEGEILKLMKSFCTILNFDDTSTPWFNDTLKDREEKMRAKILEPDDIFTGLEITKESACPFVTGILDYSIELKDPRLFMLVWVVYCLKLCAHKSGNDVYGVYNDALLKNLLNFIKNDFTSRMDRANFRYNLKKILNTMQQ